VKTLLIDGDILLYRFGFRQQEEYDWGNGVVSKTLDPRQAKRDAWMFVKNMEETLEGVGVILCFSGPSDKCFRKALLPSYKHNRKGCNKPDLYYELRDWFMATYEWKQYDNLEADDCMGIMATMKPGKYIVCTIDKDLKQIPGDHFNWDKDESYLTIDDLQADLWFYQQVLTGDSTDGFSGCPGIGPAKAGKILLGLEDPIDIWKRIVETYKFFNLDESYALLQARMARILRASDYDFDNKKPILWVPSK
jgi:DNA polymerase I